MDTFAAFGQRLDKECNQNSYWCRYYRKGRLYGVIGLDIGEGVAWHRPNRISVHFHI